MPNKEIIISTLKSMKPELSKKYHIDSIALFGSVARGEAKEDSDVDIAVETSTSDYFVLYDLKENLEEALGAKVDLVRLRADMNPRLKNRISKDAVYV